MDQNSKKGYLAEDVSKWLLDQSFFSDFTYQNPQKTDGKEATDIMIWFDDTVIIVEVKSQATDNNPKRWARKRIKKAWKQIQGAAKAIRGNRVPVLKNRRRGEVNFAPNCFKNLYGLIILDHECTPYSYDNIIVDDASIPLVIISSIDLYNLVQHVNTAYDFFCYYESKIHVDHATRRTVHNESEFFKFYVENLPEISSRLSAAGNPPEAFYPNQELLSASFEEDFSLLQYGRIIDKIIDHAHEILPNYQKLVPDKFSDGKQSYAEIASELAKLSRARRVHYGKEFDRIMRLSNKDNDARYVSFPSPSRDTIILFLSSPQKRRERIKKLEFLTGLAKHYHQATKAIGIATEPASVPLRSYDFVLIDSPPVENEELAKIAQETFGGTKSLI